MKEVVACVVVAVTLLPLAFAGTTQEGLEWLAKNSKKEGVITLASGLQYKVLKSGNPEGKQPGPRDTCLCHYRVCWKGRFLLGGTHPPKLNSY